MAAGEKERHRRTKADANRQGAWSDGKRVGYLALGENETREREREGKERRDREREGEKEKDRNERQDRIFRAEENERGAAS